MKLLLLFIGVAMCMEAENSRLKQTNKALHEALNSLEESLEKNLADFGEDAVSRRFPSFRGRAPRRPSRPSRPSRPGTSRRRSSSGRNSNRREDTGEGLEMDIGQSAIPCIYGENKPEGCEQRIKPCSEFSSSEIGDAIIIEHNTNYNCATAIPMMKDTIFEGPSTNTYFVKFDKGKNGVCYGIIMQGGECWGKQPNTNGDYDCLGKCGPGCTDGQANWARDCLKHDVCSWYFGASGGIADGDCGDSWWQATNDYVSSTCKEYGNSCTNSSPDIFDAIDLVDFFAGGSGGNVEMEKVCHKDNCKGTWTNPIPRGEQWTLAASAGDSGCCSFSSGACDWCVPPGVCTPYSAEACRDAAQSAGLEEGGNGYSFEGDYSQKGCYAYETGEYANMAFYGTGGSDSEKRGSTNSDETFRPNGYDCTL